MKQTFIIKINADKQHTNHELYDFYRVGCKRKETALKYLAGWVKEADSKGLQWLYRCFFCEGASYSIIETPDGYHEGETVLSGLISELK